MSCEKKVSATETWKCCKMHALTYFLWFCWAHAASVGVRFLFCTLFGSCGAYVLNLGHGVAKKHVPTPAYLSPWITEVKEYMEMLQEEDPTKYEAHFSKYIEAGIEADKMEDVKLQ